MQKPTYWDHDGPREMPEITQFRQIAEAMFPSANWQWIGPHMSQRMFGITEARAKAYAARHGGIASELVDVRALARSSWE